MNNILVDFTKKFELRWSNKKIEDPPTTTTLPVQKHLTSHPADVDASHIEGHYMSSATTYYFLSSTYASLLNFIVIKYFMLV